jgi:hypothetical protein
LIHVHVTHEAVHKVGGIGAVLQGLITATSYRAAVDRTLLVGPLVDRHRTDPLGPDGIILYDNWQGIWSDQYGDSLQAIEVARGVRVVYGRRPFQCPDGMVVEPEILLVDVESSVPHGLNAFKHRLYEEFGLASDRYDGQWEYEQYMRLAEPALDGVLALTQGLDEACWFIAHEFMGVPTALRAILAEDRRFHTAFYAHEVATARKLVESLPGRDAQFYPALAAALEQNMDVGDVFGDQSDFYKHALVLQASHCDAILAVGDRVVDELRFLGGAFRTARIDRVYNGLPESPPLTPAERKDARRLLSEVGQSLVGFRPDLCFSHVSRLVPSKAMWRDLMVLEEMDDMLRKRRRTAVLFVLATEAGPRLPASTQHMHQEYEWPIVHREGYPDLSPGELTFDLLVRRHNTRARNSRVIFINQFGFDAISCGGALPEDVSFADLRRGTDAEFGQSIYEPFGIAQIEPIGHGALSVVSDACGCVGFLELARDAVGEGEPIGTAPVHIVGDYAMGETDQLEQDPQAASEHERRISAQVAKALDSAIPSNEADRLRCLETGHAVSLKMSWDSVVSAQLLPALERATQA